MAGPYRPSTGGSSDPSQNRVQFARVTAAPIRTPYPANSPWPPPSHYHHDATTRYDQPHPTASPQYGRSVSYDISVPGRFEYEELHPCSAGVSQTYGQVLERSPENRFHSYHGTSGGNPQNPLAQQGPLTILRETVHLDRRASGMPNGSSLYTNGVDVYRYGSQESHPQLNNNYAYHQAEGDQSYWSMLPQVHIDPPHTRFESAPRGQPMSGVASGTGFMHGTYSRQFEQLSEGEGANLTVPGAGISSSRRASVSSSAGSEGSSASDPARCCFCGNMYSGEYRKGNLARHKRQKHGVAEQVYLCEQPGCPRLFKRKDARLKHYRKHHPSLATNHPLLRRHP